MRLQTIPALAPAAVLGIATAGTQPSPGGGIVLIDTTFGYEAERVIVGGLQALGLDPATANM
jgi:hypothetical protein